MLACKFISEEIKERYRDLHAELLNNYKKVINDWLTSVDEVVELLNPYHIKKQPWGMQIIQKMMAFA